MYASSIAIRSSFESPGHLWHYFQMHGHKSVGSRAVFIQVILCQKHSFLHQLTQNMTTDCSWNYHENYKHRTWVEHVLPMFCACSFHGNSMNNLLSYWCKNKSFWQRFTCNQDKKSISQFYETNVNIQVNLFQKHLFLHQLTQNKRLFIELRVQ